MNEKEILFFDTFTLARNCFNKTYFGKESAKADLQSRLLRHGITNHGVVPIPYPKNVGSFITWYDVPEEDNFESYPYCNFFIDGLIKSKTADRIRESELNANQDVLHVIISISEISHSMQSRYLKMYSGLLGRENVIHVAPFWSEGLKQYVDLRKRFRKNTRRRIQVLRSISPIST